MFIQQPMLQKIFICIFGMIKYFIIECSSGLHIVHIAAEMAPVAKVIFVTDSVFLSSSMCDLICLICCIKLGAKQNLAVLLVALFLVLYLNWSKYFFLGLELE